MTQSRDWLIQWLRDAHAMEEQAETMLSGQLSRLESYPELRNHIRQHLDETRQQASRLKSCLDRIGEGSSAMKDAGGKLTAMAQSISGVFAGDEVMKGSLASYTFEQSARRGSDGGLAQEPPRRDDADVPVSRRGRQRCRETVTPKWRGRTFFLAIGSAGRLLRRPLGLSRS
ncbi:ferritin-like domain-containing protein [Mesorhizobium sp. BR1-1-6]|uniref:YciE/YciF ferroxidase family protein n=1 Tax=Mesorhizobium sp. BR1-1-6 TaxID=2876648 RepID=UPI00398C89D5